MKRYNVEIEFQIPDNVTDEEFEEWFKFAVISWGGCSCENPLCDKDRNNLVSNYNIRKW